MDELATRWASPPGDTIREVVRERDLATGTIADAMGLSSDDFDRLLLGELAINLSIANSLSQCLGSTAAFWLTRETQYRLDLERVYADRWSESLPLKQMQDFGWIVAPTSWLNRIEVSLEYFGVENVASWDRLYAAQVEDAHFRTSPTFQHQVEATAVWFRACELAVGGIEVAAEFDRQAFASELPELRKLSRRPDPQEFVPELVRRCARTGVQLAVVPAPKGCTASGVSRMYRDRPLIALSARHLSDDHFWFTFFHEAAHVVMHDIATPYIDGDWDDDDGPETEANRFASEVLWGGHGAWSRPRTHREVISLAQYAGVSPGVIVGQLQHQGILGQSEFNRLKRRYVWNRASLEKASRS